MASECSVGPDIGAESNTRIDVAIAALAAGQPGVVARAELVELGLGRRAIAHRVANGRLHVVHRGVYAVGHARLSRAGRWMAAVLAAGPGAALSHRSAAALWGIRDTSRSSIEVIAPRQCRRPGIDAHRISLEADEVTTESGIRVTTVTRTLLDLAEQLTPHQLERAIHEAEYHRLTSPVSLDALLTRHLKRRGTAALRAIVDRGRLGHDRTRNDFEADFLAFLDAHALPRPRTNVLIAGYEVDALWLDQRLIVELDGRQAHHTTNAFERDRAKDRHLQIHGYRVVRVTWRQLYADDARLARDLSALLA
jgi:very-short-patch-repair endonuclease